VYAEALAMRKKKQTPLADDCWSLIRPIDVPGVRG